MTDNTQPITLTAAQLRGLLALAGLSPGEASPLADLQAEPASMDLTSEGWHTLRDLGWVDGNQPPRITEVAKEALQALCRPNAVASVLLGTRKTAMTTTMYSAHGLAEGTLVSFLAEPDEDTYVLGLGQSPSTLVDAVAAQVFAELLDSTVLFSAVLPPTTSVTTLGILEWRLRSQLQAMLDREPSPAAAVSVEALWEILAEGRTSLDLAWPVTALTYLFPFLDFELDEAAIQDALATLEARELIAGDQDGRYSISSALLDLADALLPLLSFAALHVDVQDRVGQVNSTHLAFLRGGAAMLIVQPVLDKNGERVMAMDSVEAERLAEVLFELGLPGRLSGAEAPLSSVCSACGAGVRPGLAFCTQCGAPLQGSPQDGAR